MSRWNPFNGKKRREGNVVALPPKLRKIEEVTVDYNRACLQLGHLEHERWVVDQQIRGLHEGMVAIGAEAKAIQEREAKDKPATPPVDAKEG